MNGKDRNKENKAIFSIWIKIFMAEIAMLEILYVAGAIFFSNHFFLQSSINGVDVSLMTAEEAQVTIEAEFQRYQLEVLERGGKSETIYGSDINLQYELKETAEEAMNQQILFLWFVNIWGMNNYVLDSEVTYDSSKLIQQIQKLDCMQKENSIEPMEPQIVRGADGFIIEDGTEGNQLSVFAVRETIKANISGLMTFVNLEEEDCYIRPKYEKDDPVIVDALNHLNRILEMEVVYQFGNRRENLDAEKILEWVSVSENYEITVENSAIEVYVNELKDIYEENGDMTEFRTTSGDTAALFSYVADTEEAMLDSGKIADLIMNIQDSEKTKFIWDASDVVSVKDTYIEINLITQHLWCYKDGVMIMETDIISGKPEQGNATATGIYAIRSKMSPASLTGKDKGRTVSYWMAFDGNIALHDADWRNAFGENYYILNGSEGSIYVPSDMASILYENYNAGDIVIVYDASNIIDDALEEDSDDSEGNGDARINRVPDSVSEQTTESSSNMTTENSNTSEASSSDDGTTEAWSGTSATEDKTTEAGTEATTELPVEPPDDEPFIEN